MFVTAVEKKHAYSSVQFVEMQDGSESFAASADTDVLYLSVPSAQAHQWFFVTDKGGKQVFAFDRSGSTPAHQVLAFVERPPCRPLPSEIDGLLGREK